MAKTGSPHQEASAVWEVIAEDVRNSPDILRMNESASWPPAFAKHKIVREAREAGERMQLHLGVYIDGVVYSQGAAGRIHTVTGIWIIVLATQKKILGRWEQISRLLPLRLQGVVLDISSAALCFPRTQNLSDGPASKAQV